VLACSDARRLVLDSGEPHRLAPSDGTAVGAGDLAMITLGADADFTIAAHAAEKTSLLIDHRTRTSDVSGHGRGVERWSTLEHRLDHRDDPEGSGRSPRAFALSAARSGYPTTRPPPTIRPTVPPADRRPGPHRRPARRPDRARPHARSANQHAPRSCEAHPSPPTSSPQAATGCRSPPRAPPRATCTRASCSCPLQRRYDDGVWILEIPDPDADPGSKSAAKAMGTGPRRSR
jgi:hypothetical protein